MAGRWGYGLLMLVIGGLLAYLMNAGPQAGQNQTLEELVDFYRLFPDIQTPEAIIGLEILIPAENFGLRVVNEAGNATLWRLGTDPFTPVDPNAPNFARWRLASIEGLQSFNRSERPLEFFGLLPNPQYVIRFQLEDLRVLELQVGNRSASGNAYYVTTNSNGVIVDLVEAFWIDEIVGYMLSVQPLEELEVDSTIPPVP